MKFFYKFLVFAMVIILKSHISEAENIGERQNNKNNFQLLIKQGYKQRVKTYSKYIVSLFENQRHFCGGAIYTDRKILTAAHCFSDGSQKRFKLSTVRVVAGTINRLDLDPAAQVRRVKQLIMHDFKGPRLVKDITMLILDEPLIFDGINVAPIKLPTMRYPNGTLCHVLGWGCLYNGGPSPLELVHLDAVLINNKECNYSLFEYGMICAKEPDDSEAGPCQGDSGGPLLCGNVLVGIASFTHQWCLGPEVYTDVLYYLDWIKSGSAYSTQKSIKLILVIFGMIMILT